MTVPPILTGTITGDFLAGSVTPTAASGAGHLVPSVPCIALGTVGSDLLVNLEPVAFTINAGVPTANGAAPVLVANVGQTAAMRPLAWHWTCEMTVGGRPLDPFRVDVVAGAATDLVAAVGVAPVEQLDVIIAGLITGTGGTDDDAAVLAAAAADAAARVAAEAVLRAAGDAALAGGAPGLHAPTHAATGTDPVTLAQTQITGLSGALAGKADLVGGVLVSSQIPALAISDVFAVASQAAMLALVAQRGDVAVRTDTGHRHILSSDNPGTLADWIDLGTAVDGVSSVNSQQGVVVLGPADVGAQPVDSDLTAIAALATTPFGRDLLTSADATAARAKIGAGTVQPSAIGALRRQHRNERRRGPASTDITSVVAGGAATLTGSLWYPAPGGVLSSEPTWPIDFGEGLDLTAVSGGWVYAATPSWVTHHSMRVMTDAPSVEFTVWNTTGTIDAAVYVNGAPYSANPVTIPGIAFLKVTLATPGPNLIEVRSRLALFSIGVANPYRIWRPPARVSPRLLVVGDSHTIQLSETTYADSETWWAAALDWLDIDDVWVDGVGGTGYVQRNGGSNNYVDRLPTHLRIAPDVVIVEGGGGNDFSNGASLATVTAAATNYLTQLRAGLPNAKIIVMENFGVVATYNASYVALVDNLIPACTASNVYYIDANKSGPWVTGTGHQGATTGTGNADIYVGNDGIHPTRAGARYLRGRVAPILQAAMSGNATINARN